MSLNQLTTAARRIGRRFGVGGSSWAATAPASGLGGTPTSAGTVTGYAVQGMLGRQALAGPGTPVEPLKWYFVVLSGTIGAGYQLSATGYTFSVVGLAAAGLGVWEIECV